MENNAPVNGYWEAKDIPVPVSAEEIVEQEFNNGEPVYKYVKASEDNLPQRLQDFSVNVPVRVSNDEIIYELISRYDFIAKYWEGIPLRNYVTHWLKEIKPVPVYIEKDLEAAFNAARKKKYPLNVAASEANKGFMIDEYLTFFEYAVKEEIKPVPVADVKELPEVADLDAKINSYVQAFPTSSYKDTQGLFFKAIDAINKSIAKPVPVDNKKEDSLIQKAIEEKDKEVKDEIELLDFLNETHKVRQEFIVKANEGWWYEIGVNRVVFEDILIMYDQMQERLQQPFAGNWFKKYLSSKDATLDKEQDKIQKAISWCKNKYAQYELAATDHNIGKRCAFEEMKQYLISLKK